jgi:uncharacterized protein YyaL (SSP411 family)
MTLTNQLADQSSPYLLQHAENPVAWQAWSDAAFELAQQANKPVLLSVGYSTCHWCHVMAHQSFEDEQVAAALNEHFVPIKVDREELPDIDAQYMLATQAYYALSGNPRGGGWPNSVWLMPDGRPFFAGTYFPKPQFIEMLNRLHELWTDDPQQIDHNAEVITQYMQQLSGLADGGDMKLSAGLIEQAVDFARGRFDAAHGGFGGAPKFPPHGALALLASAYRRTADDGILKMHTQTLDAMCRGGIYDHVGGGFHRYATDGHWFLPHFEKMLYDNAQLIRAYTDGFQFTDNDRYRQVVAETFDWLSREMTDEHGGFYSALDADSEGEEGKFYVWHVNEIRDVLGEDAEPFIGTYHIAPDGNWVEEASGHQPGTNIPHLTAEVDDTLPALRQELRQVRDQRIPPHLDDKVLTSWNGLMITALARAGRQLDEPRYTEAAARAADFILRTMRDADGRLLRVYRDGRASQPGYLDDYAYLIDALIELHEATDDSRWLAEARALADEMIERFGDPWASGFFYTSTDHDHRVMRSKNPSSGGNMPSPNGVAAFALLRLGELTGEVSYTRLAHRTLVAFAGLMREQPYAADELLVALDRLLHDGTLTCQIDDSPATMPVVTATIAATDGTTPGRAIDLTISVDIAPPYHIYGPRVASSGLSPTRLNLADGAAELTEVRFPKPQTVTDPVSNRPIDVYRDRIDIGVTAALPDDASGNQSLKFRLTAQPCDDRACLAPITIDLPVVVEVA